MTSETDFDAAAQRAQQLPGKPANTTLLQLYGQNCHHCHQHW